MIGCVLPRSGVSYTLYVTRSRLGAEQLVNLLAILNSFAFDYFVRQKTTQSSLPMGPIYETAAHDQAMSSQGSN